MAIPKEYDDLPGTVVFDAEQARRGYHLNMFCMSLMKAENRATFKADERAYLDRYPMTEEQKQSILKRDWNGMLQLGGNIYFVMKIGFVLGQGLYHIGAQQRGETYEEFMSTRNESGAT